LKQLLQAQEGLPISKGLEDLYKKYFDEARPTFDQYSELLQFETRKHAKVFIVIDALDECTDGNREKLLRALQTLRVNANFLFTSREHINIKKEFPNAKELQVYARDADLQIYIKDRIRGRLALHCMDDATLQTEIVDTVARTTKGM
jgi:hypothetical protein